MRDRVRMSLHTGLTINIGVWRRGIGVDRAVGVGPQEVIIFDVLTMEGDAPQLGEMGGDVL